jgi:hypothetical protein
MTREERLRVLADSAKYDCRAADLALAAGHVRPPSTKR